MARRAAGSDSGLAATFTDLGEGLVALRRAAESGGSAGAALDEVLDLVNVLDQQCRDLNPG